MLEELFKKYCGVGDTPVMQKGKNTLRHLSACTRD
jgi:hypothetical protein